MDLVRNGGDGCGRQLSQNLQAVYKINFNSNLKLSNRNAAFPPTVFDRHCVRTIGKLPGTYPTNENVRETLKMYTFYYEGVVPYRGYDSNKWVEVDHTNSLVIFLILVSGK